MAGPDRVGAFRMTARRKEGSGGGVTMRGDGCHSPERAFEASIVALLRSGLP